MTSKKGKHEKISCPKCQIKMNLLYKRSYGDLGYVYECPKCKGLLQK